jgi:murein DD-endopeptidase MepM/ murein hydrolase activator NlpD
MLRATCRICDRGGVGSRSWRLALVLLVTVLGVGPGVFLPSLTPRESYLRTLRRDGLAATAEGRAWIQAGEDALRTPRVVPLPAREEGTFAADQPQAVAYAVEVQRGRRLSLAVRFDAATPLFLDLFRMTADGEPRWVASLAPGRSTLTCDVDDDAVYVVRLQPELRRTGGFALAQRTRPSLAFPVADGPARGPHSAFGVARDAGRRRHEGLDFFAPRGTAVVAVAAGVARRATNRLGGNVVWLHAPAAGQTYYYAHLDRWAVGPLSLVRAGDVLGYIGNTGNAARTAPHLHFGIYEGRAIDPWPFVQPEQPIPSD